MPENNINNFAESINREAERQKKRIEAETKRHIDKELAKAYNDARRKSHEYIGRETSKIMVAAGLDISQKNIMANDMLFKRRQEICDEVYGNVLKMLADFTASPDYENFLIKSAEEITSALSGSVRFFIRSEDSGYIPLLQKLYKSSTAELDSTIKLGGLKATDENGKIMINDTLDIRFEQEKQKFRQYSGLTINKQDG